MKDKFFLRNIIGGYMSELGVKNDKVVVVNADLMRTSRNDGFISSFPERSFNVGIAEQDMVSFSAGLAHEGFIPYAFSMAPFISMRACEQCRTDVAYPKLNVRLIATYAGESGGISGPTHWGIEDCGIMRCMPNMTVLEPSDPIQAKRMLDASLEYDGPIYIRSSVEAVDRIYDEDYDFEIGKASVAKEGSDGTIICSGVVVSYAMEAANELLLRKGLKIRVLDVHTIKPIDEQAIIEASETKNIIVAQDHNVIGGLGTAVAEVLAKNGISVNFKVLGIQDRFDLIGHAPFLYSRNKIDTEGLIRNMLNMIGDQNA